MSYKTLVEKVGELYNHVDRETKKALVDTTLACPPQCGQCCYNPNIETTVLEALPLANYLIETGQEKLVMERARESTECVLLKKGTQPGTGRCTAYPVRYGICRLFGYAAMKNKTGGMEFVACKIHKSTQSSQTEETSRKVQLGTLKVPSFVEYRNQLENIDPTLSKEHLNINAALISAIEKLSLEKHYESEAKAP